MSKKEMRSYLDSVLSTCFACGSYELCPGALLYASSIGIITNEEWLFLRRACHVLEGDLI